MSDDTPWNVVVIYIDGSVDEKLVDAISVDVVDGVLVVELDGDRGTYCYPLAAIRRWSLT